MPAVTKLPLLLLSVPFVFSTLFSQANAAGMVPETTLLVIEESTHSGVMNVKNTDSNPALLYTTVVDLPDDNGVKLDVTQPVVRVEAGQQQQLRFIMEVRNRSPSSTISASRLKVFLRNLPIKE